MFARVLGHLARLLLNMLVSLVILGALVFYFGYWETPRGRCDRGDLGACIVHEVRGP